MGIYNWENPSDVTLDAIHGSVPQDLQPFPCTKELSKKGYVPGRSGNLQYSDISHSITFLSSYLQQTQPRGFVIRVDITPLFPQHPHHSTRSQRTNFFRQLWGVLFDEPFRVVLGHHPEMVRSLLRSNMRLLKPRELAMATEKGATVF